MGALETLHAIIYGSDPSQPGGKLREAPNRLQMYALEKLMRGANAVGDYHDWMNDLDAKARAREAPSFDESYMEPEDREKIEYWRKKYRETTGKELNIPATTTAVSGGPASGGITPPTDVVAAEKKGETAGDRAISAYKAAEKTGGDYSDFSSFMSDYVRRAERDTAAEETERRTGSVNIDIPGGYEGMQRIAQQALLRGSDGGGLTFGDPDAREHWIMGGRGAEWPYEVGRSTRPVGKSVPGGSFSVGGGVTGGDTESDRLAYVDNYRNTEVDRQIGLIEQAFPAAYRPPALDARLQSLYQARAQRDAEATDRARLPIEALKAEADYTQAGGMNEYYRNYGPTQIRVAELGLEEAQTRLTGQQEAATQKALDARLAALEREAAKDPSLKPLLNEIRMIVFDPRISLEEKNRLISERFGNPEGDVEQKLSRGDALLFNTPGG